MLRVRVLESAFNERYIKINIVINELDANRY